MVVASMSTYVPKAAEVERRGPRIVRVWQKRTFRRWPQEPYRTLFKSRADSGLSPLIIELKLRDLWSAICSNPCLNQGP